MQAALAQRTVGRHSFPRRSRLLKPSEFKSVFDQAVVSSDRLFKVFACVAGGPQSRLGMAVSRRVDPRSSVRNRIRRVIRESFRVHHPLEAQGSAAGSEKSRAPGRDYVVLAAPPSAAAPNAELRESLSRHWCEIDRKIAAREDGAAVPRN